MSSSTHVSWFEQVGLGDRPDVGGKGGSLGELMRAGIAVPPGFVVRTGAFERFIEALERGSPVRACVEALDCEDLEAAAACSRALRTRLEEAPLPAEVLDEITSAHTKLCGDAPDSAVAVRSSATTEDAADASFAGLQDTYLWVLGAEAMLHRVRSCWASLYSAESISYRLKRGFPESGVAMAVVVQRMVDARTAGVMFTRSPTTGDRSVVTIEGAWGLGSAVVGGEVTPDRWVVGKITGEISARDISEKAIQHVPAGIEAPRGVVAGRHEQTSTLNGQPRHGDGIETVPVPQELRRSPCLSDAEIQALRDIARQVERHYGRPQDIEWAIERRSGEILLLQSRPETVWSAKESAPAARPADNPLAHVMSIFGGRR